VAIQPDDVDLLELARDLAEISVRKRPWQLVVVRLYDLGWVMDEETLRHGATWLLERDRRVMLRLVQIAHADGLIDDSDLSDPYTVAAAISHRHRDTRSMRGSLRTARRLAGLDHPDADRSELAQLATDYLAATLAERFGDPTLIADAVLPGIRHEMGIQRSGRDRPAVSFRDMHVCASTLSQDEANLCQEVMPSVREQEPEARSLTGLYLCVRLMADLRLETNGDPSIPTTREAIAYGLGGRTR
jgi:hypothetical protein